MNQVKNLQKENLKLKGEISAVNSELEKLKSIIEQQQLQADIEQVWDAATRYENSVQKSVDFLCEDYHITKNFRENMSKELDNLSRKLEAISRVDSLDAAIDDLLKYSFQALFTDNIIMQINFSTIFRIPSSISVIIIIIYISWEISI